MGQQPAEASPTPPATQELTLKQFVRTLLTAWQNNDVQKAEQLVTDNPSTAGEVYQRLLKAGQGESEDEKAQAIHGLMIFLEQFPIVKTLAQAGQLNQQVIDLYSQGKYAEAIPLAEYALALREKALGPEHPDTAISLNNLAELYRAMGAYAKAEPPYQRALAIREKVLGLEHPDTAISLNNLAGMYRVVGAYAKAVPLYQRALAIQEKVLGPEHPDVAASLNNLAALYHDMGAYARAEPLYQRALAIKEKILGSEHPDTAISLNNLAALYHAMGAYAKAEPLYQRALAIMEKVLGPEHPDVAADLNNLAGLYKTMGAYAKAELLYRRALAIWEKVLGPDHPNVAASLNNLAALYHAMGMYAKAEPLYQRAMVIREKALGPNHPDVAQCLNNLAELSHEMGDYAKAEPLYQRAMVIREKALGANHPDVADSLNNLAMLYKTMGDYAKAESFYQRVLTIREKVLGPEHPNVAQSFNNLATLYHDTGDYANAEPFYQRALTIWERALGPDHPDTAQSLDNLAGLYYVMGDYANAKPLCQRALAIKEKILGPEHPNTAISLNNLATLFAAQGNIEQAYTLFLRAQQIDEQMIAQVLGFTAEAQQQAFLATTRSKLEGFLTLVNQHLAQNAAARKDGLNVWLQRKGVILEAQKRFQEALLLSDDPDVLKTFEELSQVRIQLSQLTFAGPGKEPPEVYKQRLDALKQKKEVLEAKLSRLSAAFAASRKVAKADVASVAKALPPNTALVEFAQIRLYNFTAKGKEKRWQPAHYLAFVLHAGQPDAVGLLDLGAAAPIDQAIANFRQGIEHKQPDANLAQQLYQQVFAPLLPELKGVKEVFLSPDGQLNLLPFEILVRPDGKFLIEDYTFTYLAAGRDLVGFNQPNASNAPQPPLIIGDPDFDAVLLPTPTPSQEGKEPTPNPSQEGKELTSTAFQERNASPILTGNFKRLPGTKAEVAAIQRLFGQRQATLFTDRAAVDAALLKAQAPRILHLATHGFFLEDQELPRDENNRSFSLMETDRAPKILKDKKGAPIQNPLLRSGIVLAGVNPALQAGRSDGVMTAEKILSVKLRGTDLVVLSACETGLGDVQVGEGVYGLRRAFLQAGAKSLVMSLWAVPDAETKELMTLFYQNVLSNKLPRNQALRQAALQQMAVVRQRYGSPNPYYWGAFVFLGEP